MSHLFVKRLGSHELLRSCFLQPLDQAPAFFEASFQVLTRLVVIRYDIRQKACSGGHNALCLE
jgi:thiaminase